MWNDGVRACALTPEPDMSTMRRGFTGGTSRMSSWELAASRDAWSVTRIPVATQAQSRSDDRMTTPMAFQTAMSLVGL